jgi:uncharacterized protein involved in exopolysaccharide biosynthesis
VVAICVLAATTFAFLTKPIYRAEVVLLPVTQEGDMNILASMASQFGALGSLAGLDTGGGMEKERALAMLHSRALSEKFILDKQLLPRIFADDWDPKLQKWKVGPEDVPTLWDAQKAFDEDIRFIEENRRTGMVTVAIEWEDPVEAAGLANDLVRLVNHTVRLKAIEEAEKSLAYLNKELEETQAVEIRQAIFKLSESQARKVMLANVRDDYAFQVIDPATPPDSDDYVRPQRLVLILAGLLAGLAAALAVTIVVTALRHGSRA